MLRETANRGKKERRYGAEKVNQSHSIE